MSLTQQIITKLAPQEKPYEVRDDRIKGFLLRVQPTGRKSYIVEYARGKRVTLGDAAILTLTAARNAAIEVLGKAAQGIDPREDRKPKTEPMTLRRFIDQKYRPWAHGNHKSSDTHVKRIESCFSDLLDRPLLEITPWLIEKYRLARLKAGIASTTINRDIVALKACLTRAAEWGEIAESPLKGKGIVETDRRGVVRFLDQSEESRLYAALDRCPYAYLRTMVIVSLHTGIRRGELFGLEWRDIDLARRSMVIHGPNTKNRTTRHAPLNDIAAQALTAWKRHGNGEGLVFPGRDGGRLDNARKSFAALLRDADIKNFRWHDMRHHFASKLVQAGVDLNTVRELMGHSDIKMTLRYAHLAPEHKAAAVAKLVG
ncbi:site-specific integrase [Methylocaldum sp. 14B]|uniref:site-specific integrase n=1 Tax=Methylocaldum sp. 14B TaxID=1912213 RepID=UPI00098B852E|nr:site-specific integrase [Methylocaldum sp. 14B]